MASRMKPKKKSGKLSSTPSIEPSHVRKQLEGALNYPGALPLKIPKELVSELCSTKSPKKIAKVAKALRRIAESSGEKAEDAFTYLSNKRLAKMLVANPEETGRISASAKSATPQAFFSLSRKAVSEAFLEEPGRVADAFVQVAEASEENAKYALGAISEFPVHFHASPEGVSRRIAFASKACGRKGKLFFSLMRHKRIKSEIKNDFGKLTELAEASAYTSLPYYLDLLSKEKKDTETSVRMISQMLDAIGEPDVLAKRYGIPSLATFRNDLARGEKIAREAGVTIDDREIFLNFAHAEFTIGKEKTIALHREFGIEYFARYTDGELEGMCRQLGNSEDSRPLLLIAYNKSDQSNTFYKRKELRIKLAKKGYYNTIFFEAGSEYEFYEMAKKFAQKHGSISALIIGGHGEAGSIRFGAGDGEEASLDLSDSAEMESLRGLFSEDAIVLLDSCSTGAGKGSIGESASKQWEVELLAPEDSAEMQKILTGKNGRITGAEYNADAARFKNGKEVPSPKRE
jgi:hypothetical protein